MPAKEQVVLLHGLGESPLNMVALEAALRLSGYAVANIAYPSTSGSTAAIADAHVRPLLHRFSDAGRMHIVTHSMGGVVIRYILQSDVPGNLGRVVMLAPGHHGSALLELYRRHPLYRLTMGPAGQETGLADHCFACGLPDRLPAETGVIAGTLSLDPLAPFVLGWPNDGRLDAASTRLAGAQLALAPSTHDAITFDPLAILQTVTFLRRGRFLGAAEMAPS
jgi:alpha-beta hydrolase superfamily lysophospholipase